MSPNSRSASGRKRTRVDAGAFEVHGGPVRPQEVSREGVNELPGIFQQPL